LGVHDLDILASLALAQRCIGYGASWKDRGAIAARLASYGLFPAGIIARRLGHPLPDLATRLGPYELICPEGVFRCPSGPGPFFIAADRTYEPGLTELFTMLREGTVVDVGANVGFMSVRAARRLPPGSQVLAIEPHPVRFDCLRHNIEANGLSAVVTCLNCALGAEDGEVTIHDPHPSLGPHPLDVSTQALGGRSYRVLQRSLDGVVDELGLAAVRLVKIDVEGYEPQVLRGMRNLLGADLAPMVAFEARGSDFLAACRRALPEPYALNVLDPGTYLAVKRLS
jgi:FkbM family methyltransferase